MDYSSNCIKLRELCIPLYTNYLIKHKKFPVTKFTPRRKRSGIIYYIKLTNIASSSVLSGVNSKVNSNSNSNTTSPVLSGNTPSYNIDINNTPIASVLSSDTAMASKTNKTIASHALSSESERKLFKLGYTSQTISQRIVTMNIKPNTIITVLATLPFRNVVDAYNMEQILHDKYRSKRYYGEKWMESGYSECYKEDIMELDC
jgi:hypothetical protein